MLLGFALTSTLSFVSPDAAADEPIVIGPPPPVVVVPDDDVIVVPSDGGQPVVVVQAEPAPQPMAAPLPLPTPAPAVAPRKPMMGAGLMASGAALYILGVSTQISTAANQANFCKNWQEYGFNGVHGCFYYTEPWAQHAFTGYAFGSSLVLTSIGAGALGQYDAWQSVYGDKRQRNSRSRVVAGGILSLLGVGALIADGFLLRRELNDYCTTHECEVQRRTLYYALGDTGSLAMISGFAMMSYGRNYKRNRFKYGKQWSVTPQATPTMLGASGTIHF